MGFTIDQSALMPNPNSLSFTKVPVPAPDPVPEFTTFKCDEPDAAKPLEIRTTNPMAAHEKLYVSSKGNSDSKTEA